MKHEPLLCFLCAAVVFGAVGPVAFGHEQAPKQSKVAPMCGYEWRAV
jgi:hypothetical protein